MIEYRNSRTGQKGGSFLKSSSKNHSVSANSPIVEKKHTISDATEKMDTFFSRDIHPSWCKGERALWRAVIAQAVLDATSQSKKAAAKREKTRALKWLADMSEDFLTVCALAELDPIYVLERTQSALCNANEWRKPSSPRHPASPPNPVIPHSS